MRELRMNGPSILADECKRERKGNIMTPQTVMAIGQGALELTLLIAAPLLLSALAVGLTVAIFQAATQINEMTLSFIPKLVAIFAAMLIAGPWIITMLTDYMRRLYSSIPSMIG